jgi:hypothetical protein
VSSGGTNGFVPLTTGNCTQIAYADITIPADAPAGMIVATAKVNVKVYHATGAAEKIAITLSGAPNDCTQSNNPAYVSNFSVPSALTPSPNMSHQTYDGSVFVQVPLTPIAGASNRVYLLANQVSGLGTGATSNAYDQVGEASVVLEFHPVPQP